MFRNQIKAPYGRPSLPTLESQAEFGLNRPYPYQARTMRAAAAAAILLLSSSLTSADDTGMTADAIYSDQYALSESELIAASDSCSAGSVGVFDKRKTFVNTALVRLKAERQRLSDAGATVEERKPFNNLIQELKAWMAAYRALKEQEGSSGCCLAPIPMPATATVA